MRILFCIFEVLRFPFGEWSEAWLKYAAACGTCTSFAFLAAAYITNNNNPFPVRGNSNQEIINFETLKYEKAISHQQSAISLVLLG